MFKPHRGPQKPKIESVGINPFNLIKFLEQAKERCVQAGEEESAFRFECMIQYFKQDYHPSKPLKFNGGVIGF